MSSKITAIRGDTKTLNLTFKDDTGTPVNLTGSKVYLTVKKSVNDSDDDALIKKDVTGHTNATAGETQITLSATDTNIEEGLYVWDIQIKYSDNSINSTMKGDFEVVSDVTRRTT